MTDNWKTFRDRFPATRRWAYLNSAAAGPLARETAAAVRRLYDEMEADGDLRWETYLAEQERSRARVAAALSASPDEVAFTRATSHGMALVARMLWEAGGREVVSLRDEFPASTLPFLHRGFGVRWVEPRAGAYRAEDVEAACTPRTVAAVASMVQYATGFALDAAAVGRACASRGVRFVLNMTQAFGALVVEPRRFGADFACGTSHKWLCAGYGAGILWMRRELRAAYRLPEAGWLSVKQPFRMDNAAVDLRDEASVLECGCQALGPIFAVGAALEVWGGPGREAVQARVRALTRTLRARLREQGLDPGTPDDEASLSGITVVPHPDPHAAVARLQQAGVLVTARGRGVRLAVHAFNDEEEIERALHLLPGAGS